MKNQVKQQLKSITMKTTRIELKQTAVGNYGNATKAIVP